ncbi:hypothetical protein BG011_005730 [Mortierella polycephala]|uniref:Uncharacterized protein n=1 Tax=Mortierella polycephala TaxID=41804 RepID=A0A9P6QBL9_9FUNG|nr:hypothetical protein BG011_005730 [Mortierella polycephala]
MDKNTAMQMGMKTTTPITGGSISSTSSHSSDDDDYDDEDDDMQGDVGAGGGGGQDLCSSGCTDDDGYDSQENDVRKHSHHQEHPRVQFDYYGSDRRGAGNHGGLLPAPSEPAMVLPLSDREILEQEARRRRWERHADKRRKSLNGANQAPPTPRKKKRKKAKDLRKQVLLKNAQHLIE